MSNYYQPSQPYSQPQNPNGAQNLQFYQSSYGPATGSATPQGGNSYGYNSGGGAASASSSAAAGQGGYGGGQPAWGAGVSGRMGEAGGLRTGWVAAFSTEGYDGEPPLLEELGVNFGHIQSKVCCMHAPPNSPPLSIYQRSRIYYGKTLLFKILNQN